MSVRGVRIFHGVISLRRIGAQLSLAHVIPSIIL